MVLNWLTRIYNQGSLKIEAHNVRVKDVLKEFRVKLEYYLYETYAHIIIDQFFTVIIGNGKRFDNKKKNSQIESISVRFPGFKASNR